MKEHLNINEASKEQLMHLAGVGEETAQEIIDYRDQHGPFKSLDDLANIRNIKKEYIDDLKERLRV
jgi:competence protein ComEA